MAATIPTMVATEWTITHAFKRTRTVTETTQSGFEVGGKVSKGGGGGKNAAGNDGSRLLTPYGVLPAGPEINGKYHRSWTQTTTDTTEIMLGDSTVKKLTPKDGFMERFDLRCCAGVYKGWIIYHPWLRFGDACTNNTQDDPREHRLSAFPAVVPVHSPGSVTAAAEHKLEFDTRKSNGMDGMCALVPEGFDPG